MDGELEFAELTTAAEHRAAFPVMRELRAHLDEKRFLDLLAVMLPAGYRLFALRRGEEVLAVAGIQILTNLYYGRHLYLYDLVTRSDLRSREIGGRLLERLEAFARAEGCENLALSSGVQRLDAHRFYEERMGYERPSFVFKKSLLEDRS